jgi:hypothetical protein
VRNLVRTKLKPFAIYFLISPLVLSAVFAIGCKTEPAISPEFAQLRDQFWSTAPLDGDVQTPTDIKETADLPPDQLPPDQPVLIAGRIDAGDFQAFSEGEATFVMSQLPDESHGADDPEHADNCPFCKRKLKNAPKVLVRFQDASGDVIPVSAEKLFGLAKNDIVVVQGDATFDPAVGTVMINATKLYRR